MAAYCLPKKFAAALLQAFKDGTIKVEDLMGMKSADRRKLFEGAIGKENAAEVNSLFEGATVTSEEAENIAKGAKVIADLRTAGWNEAAQKWASEDARLQYGAAYVKHQDYVGELLREANTPAFKDWIKNPKAVALELANSSKGVVAAFDNSFFGRQGVKVLFTNPDIWAQAFAKSWGDIAKSLMGGDPMSVIKADVFSRPNAMNGKYRNGKFAIGINYEEAFPTHLPEKIPVLGRLYKASEQAYSGAALRMRADLADRIIPQAERFGVNMSAPGKQAEAIGHLINAMTGRGDIGQMSGEVVNAAFFSIRFLKSNWDTLTMHSGGLGVEAGPARAFVQRKSAENLVRIAGGMAAVLFTADQLWPGNVEADPRSSNFGKIKIGDTRFDISGGMGSLVTLASRLMPTLHDGQWGFWSKSSTTGEWTDLAAGKFGRQTALDIMEQFWEGKLSPLPGAIRDIWKGKTYGGDPITPIGIAGSLVTPMGVQTAVEALKDPKSAPLLATVVADSLGFSANTYASRVYNVWGQPNGTPQDPDDPVAQAFKRVGIELEYPPRRVRGVRLPDNLYDAFVQVAGDEARKKVSRLVTPRFAATSLGHQEEFLKKAVTEGHDIAINKLMQKFPMIFKESTKLKQVRKQQGSGAAKALGDQFTKGLEGVGAQ